jgi:hypothetical protein
VEGAEIPPSSSHCEIRRVILLGDRDTMARADVLKHQAADHGATIIGAHAIDAGEARSNDALQEISAIVEALQKATEIRADIWVPFPMEDLSREEHIRRLDLVLERRGLDLLLGPHLAPCPEGGINAIDFALRLEVHAVDALDQAVLAAAGTGTLAKEIELFLATITEKSGGNAAPVEETPHILPHLEATYGPLPSLPPPDAPWHQRQGPLKKLAVKLTQGGMTQTQVAEILQGLGHRPPAGGAFKQVTVSRLLAGRYARGSIR